MPPVYAFISFLSYRFFREYTYYSLLEIVYEAITLSAFLLLLIEFVADSSVVKDPTEALARKEKQKLVFPLCCWRYRPTKAYFMYAVKWSVLQYVVVRPVVSLIAMLCEAFNVLCPSQGFNAHYANVYLAVIDFISISIALYGLVLFYSLTKEELEGRRPLAKFLAMKLIVIFTFYQSFLLSALAGKAIHATKYWTATNVANGVNALATCIEMMFFAAFMLWAYSYKEYKRQYGTPATSVWRPLRDSVNYSDFAKEIMGSLDYYLNHRVQSRYTNRDTPDFDSAFGITAGNAGNDRLPYKRYTGRRVHHVALGEMQVIGPGRGRGSRDVSPAPPPYFEDASGFVPPEKPDDVHLDSKSPWY